MMVGAMDWGHLPHDITYLIFKELSHLDGLDTKGAWQDIISMLLVNKSWNRSLQQHMVQNSSLQPLLRYGSELFALAALERELSKTTVLVVEDETETGSDNTDNDKVEPNSTDNTENMMTQHHNESSGTGSSDNTGYKTTTDPSEVYPGLPRLEDWLYFATRSRFVRCMELLMKHGAPIIPINGREDRPYRPNLLSLAVQTKCVDAVKLLVAQGLQNIPQMCIHLAVIDSLESRHLPSIQVLLKFGAWRQILVPTHSMGDVEESSIPPLSYAVEADDMDMVDILVNYYDGDEDDYDEFCSPLVRAIRRYNMPMMFHLIVNGVSVNPRYKKLPLPLGEAAALGMEDAMDFLIDHGADIDGYDRDGLSALDHALLGDDQHIVDKLMEYHPTISELTYRAVIAHRSVKGLTRLLDRRDEVDPSLPSYGLCEAVSIGAENLIEVFLQYGTELTHRRSSRHALYVACGYGDVNIVKRLLDHGKVTNSLCPENGAIALYSAVTTQNTPLAKLLMEYGANPNLSTPESRSALHAAVPTGNVELIHLLLMRGASAHSRTIYGVSILDAALSTGSDEVVNLVLEYGANPADVTDEMMLIIGESPLV